MISKYLLILSVVFLLGTALASASYEDHCIWIQSDLKRCLQCEPEYSLTQAGACIQCSSVVTNCNSCLNLSQKCTQCERGYYFSDLTSYRGECKQCPLNCNNCAAYSECLECDVGYAIFYGVCLDCPDNCKFCQNHQRCVECLPKFVQSDDGITCEPCPDNCQVCNIDKYCVVCEDHYQTLGGYCVPNID